MSFYEKGQQDARASQKDMQEEPGLWDMDTEDLLHHRQEVENLSKLLEKDPSNEWAKIQIDYLKGFLSCWD